MKLHERINCILLGTLWSLAILLVLDFWLNTAYNFNMFSNAHWQYIATVQASTEHIAAGFYIALVLAVIIDILGIYLLCRPKFRKIILTPPQQIQKPATNQTPIPQATEPVAKTEGTTNTTHTNNTFMQRPPRLHVQPGIQPKTPIIQTIQKQEIKKNEPMYTHEIREIFEKNGYRVLDSKPIAHIPISLIALGTNETLWVGACNISHEQMADVILALKAIFQETLEDIEIDINAFILNPTDNNQAENAIMDVQSLDELAQEIANVPNPPQTQEEIDSGSMDAFTGYIETVLTYLGNK